MPIDSEQIKLPRHAYEPLLEYSKGYFSEASHALLEQALELAAAELDGMVRYDGTPLVSHSIGTALIVIREIGLGRNSAISTLLHDVVRMGRMTAAEVGERFGEACISILDGLCNISDVNAKVSDDQADNFRELIVSYATDPRVILIKLADRLEVMRSLAMFPPEKRLKKAWESLHLYAEIAHKLGLYAVKSELEDISLNHLEPKAYQYIANRLAETASERETFIAQFVRPIEEKMTQQGFRYTLKSRTKSVYSIWRKMKRMNIPFEEVYDLFAIRIVLDCPREQEKALCWGVYSIVTDFYTPNPDRMRDWISIPKSNGYESLHTTVVTDAGRWVEIQIRSERMDEVAERGVAAHWRYKGVRGAGMGVEEWFTRLRETMENTSDESLTERFDAKLHSGEIFIFTPNGDLRKMNEGATVLDFAFEIHSKLGTSCVGGRINQRNVSFKEKLRNGDIVEIVTSRQQKPKADWLHVVTTGKARNRIKAFLREEQAHAAQLGREELERKLKNWKLPLGMEEAVNHLCKQYKVRTGTELYGLIAQGKVVIAEVKEHLQSLLAGDSPPGESPRAARSHKVETAVDDALVIDDSLRNIDYKLAKCCNPIFGDDVFGFTTISSGITIHRSDCPNAARLRERYPYRVLPARWRKEGVGGAFRATIRIQAEDTPGLVNRIGDVISQELKINIRSMSLSSSGGVLSGLINLEVTSTKAVDMVAYHLARIKGVQRAFRVNN